jgi:DNA-directed RNA polymerase specialized sigma24 family protein
MNSVQRRLFRAFAEAGGDLSDDEQVEQFIRSVESNLLLLPPKVREAVELVWRAHDGVSYGGLAAQLTPRERTPVSVAALQQRVSRGARLLEEVVRRRSWAAGGGSVRPNGGRR